MFFLFYHPPWPSSFNLVSLLFKGYLERKGAGIEGRGYGSCSFRGVLSSCGFSSVVASRGAS